MNSPQSDHDSLDDLDAALLVWAREIPSLDPLTEGIIERIHILSHHIGESMSETLAEFHLDRRCSGSSDASGATDRRTSARPGCSPPTSSSRAAR